MKMVDSIKELYKIVKQDFKTSKILNDLKKYKEYEGANIINSLKYLYSDVNEKFFELIKKLLEKYEIDDIINTLDGLLKIDKNDKNAIKLVFFKIKNNELFDFLLDEVEKKDKKLAEIIRNNTPRVIEMSANEFFEISKKPIIEKNGRKYILLGATLNEGKCKMEVIQVATDEFYVSVCDCKAKLFYKGHAIERNDKNKDIYDKLCDKIIYEDNDGAINMSGIYYPKTQESLKLFEKLIR